MDAINESPIPAPPPPVELTPQDQQKQQVNKYLQTTMSVLQVILSGIGHVMQEIMNLILRR